MDHEEDLLLAGRRLCTAGFVGDSERGTGPVGSMTRWSSLKGNWANVANTPFRQYKNTSYEGGIATPFIVHWPNVIGKGGWIDHTPLHFIDVMPTLMEISGGVYPENYRGDAVHPLEGKSFLPLFRKGRIERGAALYFDWRRGSAVRTNDWKLVREGGDWELYDMNRDRTETRDLSREKPEIANELNEKWSAWAERVGIINK